jgi:hypothetical protein
VDSRGAARSCRRRVGARRARRGPARPRRRASPGQRRVHVPAQRDGRQSTLLAYLPAVQRERAGLLERLGAYLANQPPKKAFTVAAGKKSLKPTFLLLGDPVHVSAAGVPDDLPFALHWAELLARLGALHTSPTFQKWWPRLLKDCDAAGVWHPKNLRGLPKSDSPWAYHAFPIETDTKRVEARQTDVTFRMALIARLAGWELTRT